MRPWVRLSLGHVGATLLVSRIRTPIQVQSTVLRSLMILKRESEQLRVAIPAARQATSEDLGCAQEVEGFGQLEKPGVRFMVSGCPGTLNPKI